MLSLGKYLILLLFATSVSALSFRSQRSPDRTCEPIRIETCRDLGYNVTGMPNLVGHELQQDAQLQLQTFTPLIQYGCSSRLRFFLCSVYVPMCTEKVPVPIGPCRALCEDVRDRCQPVLQEFGFPWPSGLNCSKFPPQNNDKHMCMEGPADTKPSDVNLRNRNRNRRPNFIRNEILLNDRLKSANNKVYSQHYGLCKQFRFSEYYYYINRTSRCAVLCSADINFSKENKAFADIWVAVWATVCFLFTLFTVLTSLVDESRFKYPEVAIIFISGCYNMCSVAYLLRLLAGRYESSCHMDTQHDAAILIQEGLDNFYCTLIFVMLYFFNMAAAGWWIVLCITWYLSVRLKWKPPKIDRYSKLFHMFAWLIPSAVTIIIIVTRVIDADELVGACYVGNQSKQNLLTYVILPTAMYLLVGLTFLFMGLFPMLLKSINQRYLQMQSDSSVLTREKIPTTTLRMGIFSALYAVPTLCVFGSNVYEYLHRDSWIAAGSKLRPDVEIFTLKIFMSLIMGFTTCLWMWSSKTPLQTWKKLSRRLTKRKDPLPAYMYARPQTLPMIDKSKRSLSKTNSETRL